MSASPLFWVICPMLSDPLYCLDSWIRYENGLPVLIPLRNGIRHPVLEPKPFDWPNSLHHSRCLERSARLRLKHGVWNLLFFDNGQLIQGFAFKSSPRKETFTYDDLGLVSNDFTWVCCIVFARDFLQFGYVPQDLSDLFEDEVLDD